MLGGTSGFSGGNRTCRHSGKLSHGDLAFSSKHVAANHAVMLQNMLKIILGPAFHTQLMLTQVLLQSVQTQHVKLQLHVIDLP